MTRSSNGGFASYRTGFFIVGGSFILGYIGVTFLNEMLSSSQRLTNVFVGVVAAIGLVGAAVVGRTYWVRNNPFRRI